MSIKLNDNEVQVKIWNENGELVVNEICKCHTATDAEINTMVEMIEGGNPAYLAAILAKQGVQK